MGQRYRHILFPLIGDVMKTEKDRMDVLRDEIEAMVDKESVVTVLELLADVCYLKAEHLRDNWQDTQSAKVWDKTGDAIMKLSAKDYLPYSG